MFEQITMWDHSVLLFVQEHLQTPLLTKIMNLITYFGYLGLFWMLLLLVLLILPAYRHIGKMGVVSLAVEFILVNLVLKIWVARIRPYIQFPDITCLTKIQHDYSFPSGHAGASFAVGFLLFLCMPKKYGVPALVLAVLVAISRIYLCVHFPTDVLAGVVIGILTSFLAVATAKRFPKFFAAKKSE